MNLGQHLLIDEKILDFIVDTAEVTKKDVVLEIGAGPGNLTEKLAEKARKVIAIELDEKFNTFLDQMPKNVEIIYGDALKILKQKKIQYTQVVANIPYQIAEPLLELFIFTDVDIIWTVSQDFVEKMQQNPIYSSFFTFDILKSVQKEAFDPPPRIQSVVVKITKRRADDGDSNAFVCRKLYLQEDKKLKNGLRDLLIDLYREGKKKLSKKQAVEIIGKIKLSSGLLEKPIARLKMEEYTMITSKIKRQINI
ncbi:hypothetical protein HYX14_03915 [Candidatus Woesearchaeota archaeon]|nr:hypothetical protein [Candidatus Woesearchaeota archaeon]